MIQENLRDIRNRMSMAAQKAGRDVKTIRLVGITKTVFPETINESIGCGITEIGESRIQEALQKKPRIRSNIIWHLVGHLQTNKVKKAVQLFDMIQSLDRLHLAEHINTSAQELNKIQHCLIEVNISDEETKHGMNPDEVERFVRLAVGWPYIKIHGLMALAPFSDNSETARPFFKRMKQLFDYLKSCDIPGIDMSILSLGMSSDFEVAIEEGSTMVRIGTAIFGSRKA